MNMLLTAKLKLMSGMVIGAAGIIVMKQLCNRKRCKKKTRKPMRMLLQLINSLKVAGKVAAQTMADAVYMDAISNLKVSPRRASIRWGQT